MRCMKLNDRNRAKHRHPRLAKLLGLIALSLTSPASSQYSYDPSAADEQVPAVRYFGSAKDDKGVLLPGVSIQLNSLEAVYVFVTDEQGRFRANLPLKTLTQKVAAKCYGVGFQFVRVSKRPGPRGPRPTVQLDCILRRTASG